jgi:hypothetical protein
MSDTPASSGSPSPLRKLLTGQLPLEHETTLFILVNVLDFFMTYWMLMHRTEDGVRPLFAESNPVAAYFLYRWGPFRGMLIFKLVIVTVVCLVTQVIATRRLQTARWLLNLGTAAVSLVVVYSLTVYLKGMGHLQ